MEQNQFLYFITIPGNEPLLKTEVEIYYPWLKFAYSRPGFCTFKNTSDKLSLDKIATLPIIFSLTWGESFGIKKIDNFKNENIQILQEENKEFEICQFDLPHLDYQDSWKKDFISLPSDKKIDVIRTHKNELLIGRRFLDSWNSPWRRNFTPEKENVISRAYYKGADSFAMFLPKGRPTKVLEFGSAPGGTSLYLCKNGHNVVGVDPAEMSDQVTRFKNFKHAQFAVQTFQIRGENQFEIITSDMNLSPKLVLKEISRLQKDLPKLKNMFITIKLTDNVQIRDLENYKKFVLDMDFDDIHLVQLPYHKKECLLFARRK